MKKFKKTLSLVLSLTLILSAFSMMNFSLLSSAEGDTTQIVYQEDFQDEAAAKENWEIRNLLEEKIPQADGYKSKFKFVTPGGLTKSLQPLYYAYDESSDTYSSTEVNNSSFNATAFMFKKDVVPTEFTKKTITGSLQMYRQSNGGGWPFSNSFNRMVIGYDSNGNPVSATICKENGNTLQVPGFTHVNAANNKILQSKNNWEDMWPSEQDGSFSYTESDNGWWGSTVDYEIVIVPNAEGSYDATVKFTLGENTVTSTTIKIATVTSFGINVSADANGQSDDFKSAYDNITITYEGAPKPIPNTTVYTEDFQDEAAAKENWEIKNLLEGSVTPAAGFASKFKFVTPGGLTKSLQPLYYAYDESTNTYSSTDMNNSSFNATAFMFKKDVVPKEFTKKTIIGSLQMYRQSNGGGWAYSNSFNRMVIGYDSNGNPVSATICKENGNTLQVPGFTYVNASNNKILQSKNNWEEMWQDAQDGSFSYTESDNGWWGSTVNYEIVIVPNQEGSYDATVKFTLGENTVTSTTIKIATVTSFGINVSADANGQSDDFKSAYDNITVTYEVPDKTETVEEAGDRVIATGEAIISDIANGTVSVNSGNADKVKTNAIAALNAYNAESTDVKTYVDSTSGIDTEAELNYIIKYADAVKAVAKPSLLGTQLKKSTDAAAVDFRYAVEYVSTTVDGYSVTAYGAVVVPNQVRADEADITTDVKVTEGNDGYISNVYVTADTVKVDSNNCYYVAIAGSSGKIGTLFDCRPYIIYEDTDGTEYTVYAENNIDSTDGTDVANGQASTCCLFVAKAFSQRIIDTLDSYTFTNMGAAYDTIDEMQAAVNKIGQTGDNKPTTDDRAAYYKFIYLNNAAYEASK